MATEYNRTDIVYNQTNMPLGKFISDEVFYMFKVVVYVTLIGLVSTFGIVANTVNILVFVKQGLMSDSSNVSLCGLAVADLWCLLSLLWMSVLWSVIISEPSGLNWDPQSVMYLTAGFPYITFSCITCTISAYIAFERCVCVIFPFKVKTLFSARRSLIVVACIYAYYTLSVVPIFITLQLQWAPNPMTNGSMLVLHAMKHHEVIAIVIIDYVNSIGARTATLLVVMVCTQIMAHRVMSSLNWRKTVSNSTHAWDTNITSPENTTQKLTSNEQEVSYDYEIKNPDRTKQPKTMKKKSQTAGDKLPSKETTLIKMITAISTIFVICCAPNIIVTYTMRAVPEITVFGRYQYTFYVLHSIKFFMESINSSVNIFVYYNMSTRYRNVFRNLTGLGASKPDKVS